MAPTTANQETPTAARSRVGFHHSVASCIARLETSDGMAIAALDSPVVGELRSVWRSFMDVSQPQ